MTTTYHVPTLRQHGGIAEKTNWNGWYLECSDGRHDANPYSNWDGEGFAGDTNPNSFYGYANVHGCIVYDSGGNQRWP